ncbi:hypothetical protein MLP_37930 [Microlunatus phosphovorus NM-1]|uniref:Uncharacterized protein n=1 Tax=Microlunatus phosphovorus (strain ATCC 700054 / DSM 10555 / JCM 9379 / NBRC 101784 / NCIMB 13414 / VKM Ac-1990 / NM-1) TaxID=1032480 RepID=F5XPX6_MICPN|nr:hypothetical protein [Microlunatus phosphovorus]BAK36807.1 hypothetical protein MLP_37930 [Microlunatus phosphovorus NM-1]
MSVSAHLLDAAGLHRPGLAARRRADLGVHRGKGLHLVIPAILDASGAVMVISTRPDDLTATMRVRRRIGPVAIFDPQHLAEGLPAGMRWSPIRGCESPQTAMIRATGLAP